MFASADAFPSRRSSCFDHDSAVYFVEVTAPLIPRVLSKPTKNIPMKKLFIVALACAVAFVGATQAAQPDPKKEGASQTSRQAGDQATRHRAHGDEHVNHVQGQGTTHTNVNKTTFNQTNKTVNNNKTVNKVQVNNKVTTNTKINANTKVATLHTANAANWNKFHQQHQNFHATANTQIASAKFNAHYHIAGSQNWHGHQYAAFQNYHPQWHDHFWWRNHYHNVLLFGGGWYYWNAGYWGTGNVGIQ